MKITRTMKTTFCISWVVLALGMVIDESALIIIGCITLAILSAQVEILEAIDKIGERK